MKPLLNVCKKFQSTPPKYPKTELYDLLNVLIGNWNKQIKHTNTELIGLLNILNKKFIINKLNNLHWTK